jgi:hypothetical protein
MKRLLILLLALVTMTALPGQPGMLLVGDPSAPPPAQLLLDQYPGAAAAYSLRLLRAGYTGPCIEVIRQSDNNFSNIGFSGGVVDTLLLKSFCAGTNCNIITWFDQANNNNLSQTNSNDRPLVISNGSTFNLNSKPAIRFEADFLANSSLSGDSPKSVFYVKSGINSNKNSAIFSFIPTPNTALSIYYWGSNPFNYGFNTWASDSYGTTQASTTFLSQTLEMALFFNGNPNTSGVKLFINNVQISLSQTRGTSSSRTMTNGISVGVGGTNDLSQNFTGNFQELVVWHNDYSITNRLGIQSNINNFYNIY